MKRIASIGLAFVLSTIILGSFAQAQNSAQNSSQPSVQPTDPPLGDYARRVRKDPAAPSTKPKVFDNDNLPTDDKLSVVGQKTEANASAGTPAADKDKNKDASSAKPANDDLAKKQAAWKDWQTKLTAQKDLIDLASRELDVLQREYQLRAAAVYADAGNRLRNSAEWDKQDADYKQKIADKQKTVEDGKQKLDDMKEDARKAGVPSSMIE